MIENKIPKCGNGETMKGWIVKLTDSARNGGGVEGMEEKKEEEEGRMHRTLMRKACLLPGDRFDP